MKDKISWQDKRIAAINRWSNKRGIPCSDTSPYFDEYNAILNSKANNKKEYKLERRKHENTNYSN